MSPFKIEAPKKNPTTVGMTQEAWEAEIAYNKYEEADEWWDWNCQEDFTAYHFFGD